MKSWATLRDIIMIILGSAIQAVGLDLFLIPGRLAAGGVSGIAQIVNRYSGWPIGVMIILFNIPLFLLGWRFLGGRRFLLRTFLAVGVYAVLIDVLGLFLPRNLTDDSFLNALFGGALLGGGLGLVFRAKGTTGGTDILARLLGKWRGIPLSESYLLTDTLVVIGSGLAFGWTLALYAVVGLYVCGLAAELASEGFGVVRAATIITDRPQEVGEKIMRDLSRGVTTWQGMGLYSGEERPILFCVVSRSEVNPLKEIIHEADPGAFVVIGQAHEALGEGFKPLSG
ncbi:MAG: YitT family protein [Anaerolineales bacterium]|nr:YitT family protein [Anaerolineales bacterium]